MTEQGHSLLQVKILKPRHAFPFCLPLSQLLQLSYFYKQFQHILFKMTNLIPTNFSEFRRLSAYSEAQKIELARLRREFANLRHEQQQRDIVHRRVEASCYFLLFNTSICRRKLSLGNIEKI
jgi:hypothetical protein